ncbi:MAG: hypothetical protein HY291_20120 [Planctomycetes bacterium]|nr:hypothetical protein [Planctomycetota bacterium]
MAASAVAFYLQAPKKQASPGPAEGAASTASSRKRVEGRGTLDEGQNPTAGAAAKTGTAALEAPAAPPPQDFGRFEPVKADASPQAASVAEALKKKDHPERLSALLPPKPFDKAAFEAQPAAYLSVAEPGRCYQSAQPGQDVPMLSAQSPLSSRIKQGESIKLTVKTVPMAPFSATSFDGGAFTESKLNCVTVRADKEGVASVTFVATPGTLNDCHILGAAPLSSGQVRFVIEIQPAAQQTP